YPNKTIWLYTGGTWEEVKHMRVIPYLDVLCDGEFEVEKKDENTHWVGSTNQRVIDVQRTLAEGKVVLYED
ncbi:MAG: 4Fe-4S cluster-binding domain-containing protein, partial [Faecalimonas sp.]|nr:4Fe-4S cluster-binding domain-containing protein [Faecalimonas sp.]